MSYYFAKTFSGEDFATLEQRVRDALKAEGFGVLTEIDVQATLKEKIGADFRAYKILGACNPKLAHQALLAEDKIGTMLPCNVIIQDLGDGRIEVAAVDPAASMQAVGNDALDDVAQNVRGKLKAIVDAL